MDFSADTTLTADGFSVLALWGTLCINHHSNGSYSETFSGTSSALTKQKIWDWASACFGVNGWDIIP